MAKHENIGYCEQKKEDCFAYVSGRCRVLTSGAFRRDCPFYKPKKKKKEA